MIDPKVILYYKMFRANKLSKYIGGKKRDNGNFSFIDMHGMFRVGSRHVPMTKNARMRFLNRSKKQHGRRIF